MDTVCGALNHCSRKVGDATKRAEILADNLWNHSELTSTVTFIVFFFSPLII